MEVQDGTCELPHVQEADMLSEVGRGLMLVEQVARCWGVRPLAGNSGKVVFAVIDPHEDQRRGGSPCPPFRSPPNRQTGSGGGRSAMRESGKCAERMPTW